VTETSQSELERGDALAKQGKPREAETCYTRAIELDQAALTPRFRRAHVRLFELDDAAGALEDLIFVRDHAEDRSDAVDASKLEHLLGETQFQLGHYGDAVDHFEDAIVLGSDPVVWAEQHMRLAECWERLDQPAAMAAALQAFLDLASRAHPRAADVEWAEAELARLRAASGT
jgi:tetratricopeptide (TPR) repeat protein